MIPLFLYRIFTFFATPFVYLVLWRRLKKGKENPARFYERLGNPKMKRPSGKLVWFHGASVGECLSMLPLIKEVLARDSAAHVMVTSGTITSAELMAKRLPERAFHQFIPVDFPWAAGRFVAHWRPDAVLWFESDFWPNLLQAVNKRGVPLVLLNGRISDKSFARWQRAGCFIRAVQQLFTLSFGQTDEDARRLQVLGAQDVVSVGNLKFAAVTPPFNAEELKEMLNQIGARPRWVWGSTHDNEEEKMAEMHLKIRRSFPGFLSVLAPRHPHRADGIEEMLKGMGLQVGRRSRGEKITNETDVYLADTIGEMGLIYQLAPIVFVGGSLIPFGGQNMLEPMRLGRVVIIGPHAFNFREIVEKATDAGALICVQNEVEMLGNVENLVRHPEGQRSVMESAEVFATAEMDVLNRVYRVLQERVGFK